MMKILTIALVSIIFAPSVSYAQMNFPKALGDIGRYVFVPGGTGVTDRYVLDTITGRLWKLNRLDDALYLKPVPYVKDCPKPADGKKYDCTSRN